MRTFSKDELLCDFRQRYFSVGKVERGSILDEVCSMFGYHRKYAIRLLKTSKKVSETRKPMKRGRKATMMTRFS